MGGAATSSLAPPGRLRWLPPPPTLRAPFAEVRARLEALLAGGPCEQFYAAHRRRVYRANAPEIGSLAIKELRNPSLARQVWFGWIADHPGVREYRLGVAFEARGGRTLANLGAALERSAFGLARVFIFTCWLDDAVTLTRWLAERPGAPHARVLASLAAQIADAARLGLVHHRHSSNNLMVVSRQDEPVLYTIDFSHATLGEGLDPAGLARDVARIARWILHEKLWSRETVHAFFEAVAAEVRDETPKDEDFPARMARELEAVIRDPSARRPGAS